MLTFNDSGFLVPNLAINSSLEELKQEFVVNLSSVERSTLFEFYLAYCNDLKALCKGIHLHQWINGSFVTKNTLRPSDIDFVTFLPYDLVEELGDALNPYLFPNSKINYYGMDAYIVSVYPNDHAAINIYTSDKKYWQDVFDTTRRNRVGRKSPKGFLEIIY